MTRPRVLLVRGHQTTSWHLRPWRGLTDRYDVQALVTPSTWFDTQSLGLETRRTRTLRDVLPPGRLGDALTRIPGDRYLNPEEAFAGYDIVHSQDLGFWYSMQAARLKPRLGHKLVLTVWETIPFLNAYRNVRTRPYRREVIAATDRFLCATQRARRALLLEGGAPERIEVCLPGVADDLFADGAPADPPVEHVILSAGRLVWEKGHHDVLRAVAALVRGIVPGLPEQARPRVLIVGAGPEEARLRRHADELGIGPRLEIRRQVPYHEMPSLYAQASCLVLGSLPTWSWEEQFGMVMIEALFAGLPVLAAASGAIPEVLDGRGELFSPGNWEQLAAALARGPLARPPGERVPKQGLNLLTGQAFSARLDSAYRKVLNA